MIDSILHHAFDFEGRRYTVRSIVLRGAEIMGLLVMADNSPSGPERWRIVNPLALDSLNASTAAIETFNMYVRTGTEGYTFFPSCTQPTYQEYLDFLRSIDIFKYYHFDSYPLRWRLSTSQFAKFFGAYFNGTVKDLNALRIEKVLDYEPYKAGTVVYFIHHGRIDEKYGVGKIVEILKKKSSSGDYRYGVEFLNYGYEEFSHKSLLPSIDYFDHVAKGPDCFTAKFDCGVLFAKGEKFILRGEYLYNKSNNVVLKYSKFQDKFKENDILQVPTDKTLKV